MIYSIFHEGLLHFVACFIFIVFTDLFNSCYTLRFTLHLLKVFNLFYSVYYLNVEVVFQIFLGVCLFRGVYFVVSKLVQFQQRRVVSDFLIFRTVFWIWGSITVCSCSSYAKRAFSIGVQVISTVSPENEEIYDYLIILYSFRDTLNMIIL